MSAARWEMDLSPGNVIRPVIFRAGVCLMFSFCSFHSSIHPVFKRGKSTKIERLRKVFP